MLHHSKGPNGYGLIQHGRPDVMSSEMATGCDSRGTDKSSHIDEKPFGNNDILSRINQKPSSYNVKPILTNEVLSRINEKPSRNNEKTSRNNEKSFRNN